VSALNPAVDFARSRGLVGLCVLHDQLPLDVIVRRSDARSFGGVQNIDRLALELVDATEGTVSQLA
jgi:hypothetical protein